MTLMTLDAYSTAHELSGVDARLLAHMRWSVRTVLITDGVKFKVCRDNAVPDGWHVAFDHEGAKYLYAEHGLSDAHAARQARDTFIPEVVQHMWRTGRFDG